MQHSLKSQAVRKCSCSEVLKLPIDEAVKRVEGKEGFAFSHYRS